MGVVSQYQVVHQRNLFGHVPHSLLCCHRQTNAATLPGRGNHALVHGLDRTGDQGRDGTGGPGGVTTVG